MPYFYTAWKRQKTICYWFLPIPPESIIMNCYYKLLTTHQKLFKVSDKSNRKKYEIR